MIERISSRSAVIPIISKIFGLLGAVILFAPVNVNAEEINFIESLLETSRSQTQVTEIEGLEPISEEEILKRKYVAVIDNWKVRQSHLWSNLPKGEFTINASAYTASADECGKSDGITASGILVEENRTLACPPEYPFGAKIAIDGMGVYSCEDRGGAIKGNKFDIYMETKAEAFSFGRRNLTAFVVTDEPN